MDVDIERLAKYPMESDDWIITVAIGGVAMILSFLIVPWFAIMGYLVRAIRSGMEEAEAPPVFDEWGDLLKEGVFAAIIGLVYQIIPIIVFLVFVGGSLIAMFTGGRAGTGAGMLGLFGGFFISWILAIIFGYVGFAGVANYAREGELGAGFDFDVITEVITSRDYLMAWVYVIVLNIVVGVINGILSIVPVIGNIAGLFVAFYALIIAGWLWGSGFASATADATADAGADADTEADAAA